MEKRYAYEFPGTRKQLLEKLRSLANDSSDGILNEDRCYYIQDYIVKVSTDEKWFGVERAGHSGGHWFIPEIAEQDDCLVLMGTLEYIGPGDNGHRSKWKKFKDGLVMGLLYVLLSPVVLGFLFYRASKGMLCKLCGKPIPKEKTTEEKLFDLMEVHLACVRI